MRAIVVTRHYNSIRSKLYVFLGEDREQRAEELFRKLLKEFFPEGGLSDNNMTFEESVLYGDAWVDEDAVSLYEAEVVE